MGQDDLLRASGWLQNRGFHTKVKESSKTAITSRSITKKSTKKRLKIFVSRVWDGHNFTKGVHFRVGGPILKAQGCEVQARYGKVKGRKGKETKRKGKETKRKVKER